MPARVYLVHHGEAVDTSVDTMRPLSATGHRVTERLAAVAARRSVTPAVIWHSGKLRAKQTAEHYWRRCNPLASFKAVRGLQPSDDPARLGALLAEVGDASVMLVGHYPFLPAALRWLTTRSVDVCGGNDVDPFPLNGLVALEPSDDPRCWKEAFRLTTADADVA